ncbi:MAG: ABC transporter permease [Actinobacteria bacterium]|nr:ABC transporter permease [Actinomycetota bacterium]MBW3649248.1 ABC transporter permease [Actinomycetota bacterium]
MTPAARPERPPGAAIVLAALAGVFFVAPLVGLLWRVRWADLGREMYSQDVRQALALSLFSSLAATATSAALGIPLAWVLARARFPGQRLLRALTTLPMVLPPVVGGVALLAAFGPTGVVGQWLERWFGLTLPFTIAGVVMAQTFVAMPFLVITAEAAFRRSDRRLEEAARTLGASRSVVFRRVTLPLVSPSLVAGAVLCWARAIGEFGATVTFAGNFPGRTQTIPLKVYLLLETRPQAAIALSLVLLAVSLSVLVGMRSRWWTPA